MPFTGFPKKGVAFLGKLGRNNSRDWFLKNRDTYDNELVEPAKEFVVAMGQRLDRISPLIKADPRINGSIRRINRDTRFSKDKSPYKNHLDFHFQYGKGKESPGYYLSLQEKKVAVGAGTYVFDKSHLTAYRDAVVSDKTGPKLASAIKRLRKAGYDMGGLHYKRVPRGYDPDGDRAELLKYAGLYAYLLMPTPKELSSGGFVTFCTKHFERMAPIAEWITANVAKP